MKHRLIAVVALAVMVSGCAASRAFRRGEDASRNGNWDVAVTEYTEAVQADPDKPEYKIQLERAMQSAAQAHISRAREMEEKGALDAALADYAAPASLTPRTGWRPPRSPSSRRRFATRLKRPGRGRRSTISATRPARWGSR